MHDARTRLAAVALGVAVGVALGVSAMAWLGGDDAPRDAARRVGGDLGGPSVSTLDDVTRADGVAPRSDDGVRSDVDRAALDTPHGTVAVPTPDDAAPAPPASLRLRVVRWPDDEPVPGARVQVAPRTGVSRELLASHTGRVSWTPPAEQLGWRLTAWAEGWGEATLDLARSELDREHVLRLTPGAAWVGRVEDPFGTPVQADVVAWQWWPPRPTLLDDGHPDGPRLLSHQRRRALQGFRSGVDGRFLVPRLPDDGASELVLAVRGAKLASALLRVPLPPPDGELPPLVLRARDALLVQLRAPSGAPLVGVELEIDDGPGRRDEPQRHLPSDAQGVLRVARHGGSLALRPRDGAWEWLAARADGRPLRPDESGWLEVPADAARLLLELGRPRRFVGRLRDAFDGRWVQDGLVVAELLGDDGDWRELDAAHTDATGGFDLRAPFDAQDGLVRLRAEASAYEPLQRELLAGLPDAQGDMELRPRATGGLLRGRVVAAQEQAVIGALVRVWSGPPEERGAVRLDEPLPESYELIGELRTDVAGRFELRLASAPGHQLVLLAEQSDERGLLVRSLLGPLLRDAWLDGGELRLTLVREAPATLPLIVEHWPRARAGVLESSHYYAFDGTTLTLRDAFDGPAHDGDELRFDVPLPRGGESMVELRLERWPVPEPLVRSPFWVRAPLRGEVDAQVLSVPRRVSLEGVVRGVDAARRERVGVALLGAPVAAWRSEWLGESDRAVRPDAQGRWRFDSVPLGPATLVLYAPGEVEGVEILAQHAVSLDGDVTRFELVPQAVDDAPLEGEPLR